MVEEQVVGMEVEDAARADGVSRALALLTHEADSTWFFRFLTERQKLYAIYFVRFKGDWRKAAREAGYASNFSQASIEEGESMNAYMTAIKAELATSLAISTTTVISRLNRLALRAESSGDLPSAIRANTKIGETFGMFHTDQPSVIIDAKGRVIQITATPQEDEVAITGEVLDAEYRDLMARNGKSLPGLGEEPGG